MGAACCRCQQVAFEDEVLRFASAATVGVSSSRHPIQALQVSSSASNSSSSRRSISSQSSTSSSLLQARSLLPRHRTRRPSRQSVSMNHSLANYVSFPFPWANKVEAKRSSRAKTIKPSENATAAPSGASKRAKMSVLCSLTCTMGDHYRETEGDGIKIPLSLTELCVRRVCTTLVTDPEYYGERHPGMPSEVASMLVAFLKQHEALNADHFQLLSRYLYHEWNLADQLELESGWFDSIATSPLQHVKSINFKNCANLETLGSDRWQRVDELPNLTVASFQGCVKLNKSVPDVLQHSTRLTSLNLSGCKNIDDRSLIPLRRLFLLKSLELSGCRLISDDGLKCLTGLSKLEKLVLSRCTLITDHGFEELHLAFPLLSHLDVAHCRISDIALVHIGRATSLQTLIIRGCHQIGDAGIEHLASLRDLEYFDARHCEDVRSLRPEWTKMKSLLLGRTAFSEAESTALKSMPQLTELDVRACKILKRGFECISQLLRLKRLTLAETALTDAALLQICKGVKRLTALNISHTEITDAGAEGLANLADLEVLHMDTNGITNRALSSLAGLMKLRLLDLFGTSVSDNGLQHLSGLTELRELVICSGGITDRGVEVLSRLTSLQTLNLSQNRCIHSKGLLSLRSLANLQNLNLSNTAVSVASLRHLHPLKNLESLSIFGCVVTSTEVEMLQELLPSLRTLRCS